tara:strand:- start:608 stop:901 length:294 start_codon:yes stop_codon:yes gene_type:complete
MKKNWITKFLGIVVLGLLWCGNSYAGWFDPYVYGCAFQEHNNKKIKCVKIKYNESKDPGSFNRAERSCYKELNYYGKKYGEHGYWIDGCLSSAGPYN